MESKISNTLHDLKLERDTFITIMSQRKSGKSVLLSNLIHYFLTSTEQRCHFCYLFSTTAKLNKHTNHSYSFLDPRAILSPDPSVINPFVKNLIESQKQTKISSLGCKQCTWGPDLQGTTGGKVRRVDRALLVCSHDR